MAHPGQKAFLVVGHPGHELCVHHWLEVARPSIFVLTDGSGAVGSSRLGDTRSCATAAGAAIGASLTPRPDRDWYRSLLENDRSLAVAAARAILHEARVQEPQLIVSDARDGYNPMHDMACGLAGAVCERLRREGRRVEHLVFQVEGSDPERAAMRSLQLDEAALARKIAAARAYRPLGEAVAARLADPGFDPTRECLFDPTAEPEAWQPMYEVIGRERVAAGRYPRAIEYARDVRPALLALREALEDDAWLEAS